MSHETFALIDQLRRAGIRAAMATLVGTTGTTPRKAGTKMFVGEDGKIFGSVTIGGCVDARVIEHSSEVLESASPRLLKLQLGDDEAWEIGLTCGGIVDVFIEPFTESIIEMYGTARSQLEAGRSVAIATVIAGEGIGSRTLEWPPQSATRNVFLEILRPAATLLVFGAGAVAIPLVTFAKTLGFHTVIIDGRERFADVDDIRIGISSEIAAQLNLGATTAIVLVAHDYKIDVPVLKKALASDAPYIGLLGSRRRGAAILQMLRDDGLSDEHVSRVRVPIGLDLGGETSAEIALSIMSEVVAVMHGRTGSSLSTSKRESVLA
jgi:xanthine dehydrogenase accessory factor